ncbi:MAG: stress response translation initiation inhibitor YciH [Elusimicrobia bacterium]|nr:stress response translation initiation inhibitor YciH [Elusimicrobiota bacterium]
MTDKPVYSTDPDFCPSCRRSPCTCQDPLKRRQPEPVRLEFRRGAKGSGMTHLSRLNMHPSLKEKLLSELKRKFGCGGAVKDGVLELQGDRRDPLEAWLRCEGYKVKRVGG